MNFDFSDDQKTIQEQARLMLGRECPPSLVRDSLESSPPELDALWQQMVSLGWPAMAIDEANGGLGLGYLELCVTAMELGRSLAPTPFMASVYFATELIKAAASAEQQAEWLPVLACGEAIGCAVLPDSRTGVAPLRVSGDNALSGVARGVLHGDSATFAVVAAEGASGTAFFYVDLGHSSVKRRKLASVDPSLPLAEITLDATPAEPLAGERALEDDLASVVNKAAVLLSFEQVGGCEAAIDMAKAYTEGRYAFGRQVASFQAIKHKLADMFVAKELAKSNAFYGAWAMTNGVNELPLASATAYVSAANAYYLCSKENIQAHGGMGFTWEFDCHLYYRRAQLLSTLLGGMRVWKHRLAEQILAA